MDTAQADVLFLVDANAEPEPADAVRELCRYLDAHGIAALCATLGSVAGASSRVHFADDLALVGSRRVLARAVVATSVNTALAGLLFARLHGLPLVYLAQSCECYDRNGTSYNAAADVYALADHVLATSASLQARARAHAPGAAVTVLRPGVDTAVFAPPPERNQSGAVRAAAVLERGPDKGQGVLLDVLHALAAHEEICATAFLRPPYEAPESWSVAGAFSRVPLPQEPGALAAHLRECDIFVDTSLYAGGGSWVLRAMASGAALVAAANGNAAACLEPEVNGLVVKEVNRPEQYVALILKLARDRGLLARLQRGARQTALRFDAAASHEQYAAFFRDCLQQAVGTQTPQLRQIDARNLSQATLRRLTACFPLRQGVQDPPEWRELKRLPGGVGNVDHAGPVARQAGSPHHNRAMRLFSCRGWAADQQSQESGGAVYLVLRTPDAEIVVPTARAARPDVAANLGSERYVNAGWQVAFLGDTSESKSYQLCLRILRRNGAEYCEIVTDQAVSLVDG